ncbi:MAG: AMP-binding protein [Novosphingobium sp.]|nr:AMP-binding protein [Novosphingobium sp.]
MAASEQCETWLDRIEALAREHPDLTAITITGDDGETLSWRDLTWRIAGIAQLFAERGVQQGSTVCLRLPNCTAFVLGAFAAWRLGATILPLRWDMPPPERAHVLKLGQPVVIVSEQGDVEGELAASTMLAAPPIDPASLPPPLPASPAWMIASGGSTGTPKLISPDGDTVLGEGGMRVSGGQSLFADNSDHRHPVHLVCAPLYHTHAFSLLFRTLVEDFRLVLMPKFDAECFLDLVEQEHVNFFAIVPTMVIRLLASPTIKDRDLSSVENAILGAGATPEWAVRQWIDVIGGDTLLMGYGMSEGLTASFIRGSEWLERPGSVGQSILADVRVSDEDGNEVQAGEVGELYFRPKGGGEHAFRYFGDAKIRSLPGGWASVGDLGRVDADGYMFIVDRRTDMIVSGGANVFVSEVEGALLGHDGVADVAVIGLPDLEWGRRVHAIVVLKDSADPDGLEDELRSHCKTRLASYKAPRTVEFVDDLGRSEAGKLNRQALVRAREEENT